MSDDRRAALELDRDALFAAIAACEDPGKLPALVREHRAVLAELDALAPPVRAQSGVGVDDIAKRRAARAAGASGSDASALR